MHAASHALLYPKGCDDEILQVLRMLGPERDLLNPQQHCTEIVMKLTVGCDSQKLGSTTLKSTVRAEVIRSLYHKPVCCFLPFPCMIMIMILMIIRSSTLMRSSTTHEYNYTHAKHFTHFTHTVSAHIAE